MINIKDSLVLDDDNEYVVVSKTNYNNIEYYYILDKFNSDNFKICYQEMDELVEIEDEKLIKELLPQFFESAKNDLVDLLS
jgi:hypothetical protein